MIIPLGETALKARVATQPLDDNLRIPTASRPDPNFGASRSGWNMTPSWRQLH